MSHSNMKYVSLVFCFFFFVFSANASDSIRQPLIKPVDWKIVTVNSSLSLSAWILRQKRPVPSYSELQTRQGKFSILNWDFHRKDVNNDWDLYSDIGAYGSMLLPCGLILQQAILNEKLPYRTGIRYVETSWMTLSAVMVIKYAVFRPRPFTYSSSFNHEYHVKRRDSASFVSGHTALTSSNCMFLYLNVKDLIEKDWVRNSVLVASLVLPAFVGYARMEAGQHFLTDIMSGYLIGVSSAYLVHRMHQLERLNFQVAPNGVHLSLQF